MITSVVNLEMEYENEKEKISDTFIFKLSNVCIVCTTQTAESIFTRQTLMKRIILIKLVGSIRESDGIQTRKNCTTISCV